MKKYFAGLMSVLAISALVTTPALAATDHQGTREGGAIVTPTKKKASVVKCEKNVDVLRRVRDDFDYIKQTYYLKPTPELLQHYAPDVYGVPMSAQYFGPEKDRKKQTNYLILSDRFHQAWGIFARTVYVSGPNTGRTIDISAFQDAKVKFSDSITAQIAVIDGIKNRLGVSEGQAADYKKDLCPNAAGQKSIQAKITERTKTKTTVKEGLAQVRKASDVTRKEHDKLKKQIKKLGKKVQYKAGLAI